MKIFIAAAMALFVFLSQNMAHAQDIMTHTVGEYTIYFLPENQMTGNTGVLLNVSPDAMKKYFSEKTFPMFLKTYLVKGPKNTILVDAGFGNRLFEHLKTLNITQDQVDTILLTHMHGDHIGGLLQEDKAAFTNATLWLAQEELDYWTNTEIQKSLPEAKQQGFIKGQKVLEMYGNRVRTFKPKPIAEQKEFLLDGVRAISIFGHTPGQTAFFVGEGPEALLIWADIVHVEKIQFTMPEVAMIFDVDPKQAIATRLELLEYIAKNNILATGMHMSQNSAFRVEKSGNGYKIIEK